MQVSVADDAIPQDSRLYSITHTAITADDNYRDKSQGLAVRVLDNDRLGDLLADGRIDLGDLMQLAGQWLESCAAGTFCGSADLTGLMGSTAQPGQVDMADAAVLGRLWGQGPLVITEFMANNVSLLETKVAGVEVSPDWIEIYNPTNSPVYLQGWHLTDEAENLTKWPCPAVIIQPRQYWVVFASGRTELNYQDELGYWHANFKLEAGGGYLALVEPQGQISHGYQYGSQRMNYAYGTQNGQTGFCRMATPGEDNQSVYDGFVSDTHFDTDRGFYEQPFHVGISCDTPGVTIRYTLNGMEPTETNGTVYSGPLLVTKTTILRAAAFRDGLIPSNIDTQTYLFLADIITQPQAAPAAEWPAPGFYNGQRYDYEMDTAVTTNAVYAPLMQDAMRQIPSISLVTHPDNLHELYSGLYVNACNKGQLWERPVSVELIDPAGQNEFHINAGFRIRGQASCDGGNPKHSFRLFFRARWGEPKLNFPLFGPQGADEFDKVDLRTEQNYSWSKDADDYWGGQNTFIKDVFSRDIQRAMGQPSPDSRYYHLYLNGVYWGLYMTEERPDARFAASYLGGEDSDYDAVKTSFPERKNEATDGTLDSYRRLYQAAVTGFSDNAAYYRIQGMNVDGTRNAAYERLVDVDNLADYLICTYYIGDVDGPVSQWFGNNLQNNVFGVFNRNAPDGFKFFKHDAEHTMLAHLLDDFPADPYGVFSASIDRTGPYAAGAEFADFNPQWLHQQLLANAEYRLRFADRVQRHFFNTGCLTPENAAALFMTRAGQIDLAIIAESARWGDAQREPARTRNDDWFKVLNKLNTEFFPMRTAQVLQQLKNDTLYPAVGAPVFSINGVRQHGGMVNVGDLLTITAPAGSIYYTLDGSDSRQIVSGNAVGVLYTVAIPINQPVRVKARALNSGQWSALCEADFNTGMVAQNLKISEIMYHPLETGDPLDTDKEYIELRNVGLQAINLAGVQFTEGIQFVFPERALAAGDFVLLVKSREVFEAHYGTALSDSIAGEYTGKLDNGGERLVLLDAMGTTLFDFEYKDSWCDIADGQGYSLTINDEWQADASRWGWERFWSASTGMGGTPAAADSGPRWGDIVINEVLANSQVAPWDWIELHNTTADAITITGWYLSNDPNHLDKYVIPDKVIPGGGYAVFTQQDDFGAAFSLNALGDTVYLTSGRDGLGRLTGYREKEDFGASRAGVAFGRYIKSTGTANFVAMAENTPGRDNGLPLVGPVVISEIMYYPAGNIEAEYIELHNRTGQPVNLFDAQGNPWKITDGIEAVLPAGTLLLPNGYLILTRNAAAFAGQYTAEPGTPVIQWTAGGLDNDGEKIKLAMPAGMDEAGVMQYIMVDHVDYSNGMRSNLFYGMADPWPGAANGQGFALTRQQDDSYGDDPANWEAWLPSPGKAGTPPAYPQTAISPSPVDNATGVAANPTLSWANGGQATSYDVYFGTDSTPDTTEFIARVTTTQYVPARLQDGATYYWRIDARNSVGVTTGEVWSFTTRTPVQLAYDDFETGFGKYTSGGADCFRYTGTSLAHQGTSAIDIQSKSGVASSFSLTNGIDVHTPGYTQIRIQFWFRPVGMETGEDFWVQYYNGSTWQTVKSFVSGADFNNDTFYSAEAVINETSYTFPTNMKIRFQCDASSANDDVYIDEVKILAN